MLDQLYIENFAIIDKVTVNFQKGLNVITGETGSGKSILIEALELLTGERFRKSMVKDVRRRTIVEGNFTPSEEKRRKLAERGFTEDVLTITRVIDEKGQSKAYINGRLQNLSVIGEITGELIDIHGQNENQSLMRREEYLKIIDRHDNRTMERKKKIQKILQSIGKLQKALKEFDLDPVERERERDLLHYQCRELDMLDLENFDEEELNREFDKINKTSDIQQSLSRLENLFHGEDFGDGGILSQLNDGLQEFKEVEVFDQELEELSQRMSSAYYELDDISREIGHYRSALYFDEERLHELSEKMGIFTDLKRKYGDRIDKLIEYREKIERRLNDLEDWESHSERIQKEIDAKWEKAMAFGHELHGLREDIARNLEKDILQNLKDLNMKSADFKILLEEKELSMDGYDKAEFLLKTNPGKTLYPLREIASGGEMSRIMLGLKAVLADVDELDTLIFDEIDTGISGRTAQIVGEKIMEISGSHQVIVISHLPQIAALSDHHLLIEKVEGKNESISRIRSIEKKERIEEMARLIAGVDITEITRKQAEEMLEQAESLRKERKRG
ncbi:MAG: DNA repair protein RecN [Tissierellia bacterium]|nr:DNA repair protein RecN [Tissierellia bacterium]